MMKWPADRSIMALRFTLQSSRAAFVPPASHWAANSSSALAAPMGMRLRLKASFDISTFSSANQVILKALKQYGMILADNGSSMYISGTPDDRWDNNGLHQLSSVTAADFEVVSMNPIYTASNLPQGAAPTISSFYRQPFDRCGGHARDFELVRSRCFLLRYFPGCWSNTRHERGRRAHANDHVFARRNESVRAFHGHCDCNCEMNEAG